MQIATPAEPAAPPYLTLYPRRAIEGKEGGPEGTRPWRMDWFPCFPLRPGQPPNPDDTLPFFTAVMVDRQERAVPIATLRRYDVDTAYAVAIVEAKACRF